MDERDLVVFWSFTLIPEYFVEKVADFPHSFLLGGVSVLKVNKKGFANKFS